MPQLIENNSHDHAVPNSTLWPAMTRQDGSLEVWLSLKSFKGYTPKLNFYSPGPNSKPLYNSWKVQLRHIKWPLFSFFLSLRTNYCLGIRNALRLRARPWSRFRRWTWCSKQQLASSRAQGPLSPWREHFTGGARSSTESHGNKTYQVDEWSDPGHSCSAPSRLEIIQHYHPPPLSTVSFTGGRE